MKNVHIKTILIIIVAGLAFSCKKNEIAPADNYSHADSTQTQVDSVGPNSDTTSIGAGTTGATGEGSTGSGSAGTTQKGNTNVKTNSTGTSSKDDSVYSGSSAPQNAKIETKKNKTAKSQNK